MKKHITLLVFLMSLVLTMNCQNKGTDDWANQSYYKDANKNLINEMGDKRIKAVFIGNSITEDWATKSTRFFRENNYVGRGISGQVTAQFLDRFTNDVLNLNPEIVVINGGINDIAENEGVYNETETFDNIKQMAEKAKASGIQVILTSVLPASRIPWRAIENTPQKVISLNNKISQYAASNNIPYVSYYSILVNNEGGLLSEYTTDGVHVTLLGYRRMQDMIQTAINSLYLNN